MKNMYEKFRDRELPPELQKHIEDSVLSAETQEERWFKAGFLVHCEIERLKETMGKDNWTLGIKVKGQ